MTNLTRRGFLTSSIAGALGVGLNGSLGLAATTRRYWKSSQEVDVEIELTATKVPFPILQDGSETTVWRYIGVLKKGHQDALSDIPGSYLGPTIQLNKGDRVRIVFKNELPEKSIIHWHGLDVSHENDGHPHFAQEPGSSYTYDFEVKNRAGTYWYHPHPHGRTGHQVYQGLAGLFIVRDDEEKKLQLPDHDQELFFVLQDRIFDEQGQLEYRPTMMGAHGDTLLINGKVNNQKFRVKKGTYRIRLLNGCNARIFNLQMRDGSSFKQVASDGGLLERAFELKRFYFAPAERIDLLLDFSNKKEGESVVLESLPLVEGRGQKFSLLEFEVTNEAGFVYNCPTKLGEVEKIDEDEAVNFGNPKVFNLIPKRGLGWTINGRAYEHNSFEKDELINFGDTEIWEFYNPTGMPHPMHIHGTQFQVIKRESGRLEGTLDKGWKDTVLVLPGDRVQVIKRFNTFKGIFIYHCHNLEHEDMNMMRNFKIQ